MKTAQGGPNKNKFYNATNGIHPKMCTSNNFEITECSELKETIAETANLACLRVPCKHILSRNVYIPLKSKKQSKLKW